MKKIARLFFFLPLVWLFASTQVLAQSDSLLFESYRLFILSSADSGIVATASYFTDAPYEAGLLDREDVESLVVNLRAFDCVTFVESVLALWQVDLRIGTYGQFVNVLRQIRYREGRVAYLSRLHYFSDWIADNEKKGYVKDVTEQLGGKPFVCERNFMSTHSQNYKKMCGNDELVQGLAACEKRIDERPHYYFPKERMASCLPKIQSGDIIALTTSVPGLDVTHVGFAVRNALDEVCLLHASSREGRVCVTSKTLREYVAAARNMTGIMIVRPLKKKWNAQFFRCE